MATVNVHQQLLQDAVAASGHVETCCLIKVKNATVKASGLGFEPSGEQVAALISAFDNLTSVRNAGIHFNGATYRCLKGDRWSIYARKEGSGFVAVRTKKFIVYGSYSISMLPSICVEVTESLGEYYRQKGL